MGTPPPGYHPDQQPPAGAMYAQREQMAQQGVHLRHEREVLTTDRATLEQQAKLLKKQEKMKKKEGKKLSKQEKELGKAEAKALRQEAERKVMAGELLTPEEQRILMANSSDSSGDEKKKKKKEDKKVKEMRKELMEIDFKIDKLLMEKERLNIEYSQATGEPLPAQYQPGGGAPYDPNMQGPGDGARSLGVGGAAGNPVSGATRSAQGGYVHGCGGGAGYYPGDPRLGPSAPQSPRKENFFHKLFHRDHHDDHEKKEQHPGKDGPEECLVEQETPQDK